MGPEAAGVMSSAIQAKLDALNERAAQRSMCVRRADQPPYGWQLANPFRVVCHGSLENIDAWLNPDQRNLAAQYSILDDRERPYYEHRMAA